MTDVAATQICVPADLGESGTTVSGIADNITTEINDLKNKLAPLAEFWTGTAADGHTVTQADWYNAANALLTDVGTLGNLATAMGTNWNNYVDTEGANTKMWQT
jgi:uncharacterized protein YukE